MGGEDTLSRRRRPVDTCNGNNMRNPLYEAFVAAGEEAGYGKTEDYNGYRQEGFGPMHMTVRRGERCSTDLAYLEPARKRSNLTVVTEAEVDTLILSDQRVTGVRYHRRGQACVANARREVILSAGSIGSPTILQRSGIGPVAVLAEAGVEVQHELPGVGENLQDHLEVYFQYRCEAPITVNGHLELVGETPYRRAVGPDQNGAGRHESLRVLWIYPIAFRDRLARYPVPLFACGHPLRRPRRLFRPRFSGARGPQQTGKPRHGAHLRP